MIKRSFLIFITLIAIKINAQDTLTVLQYNLLHYGNYTYYCTPSNNNISNKDGYVRTILDYVKPDIFCVNEISELSSIHSRMLDSNLNINGIDYYRKADFIKIADSYIVNMLYYNSEKLVLQYHSIAQSYIRDIDVYKLYYRSDDLDQGDTAHIVCVVAHLKSSSGYQNEIKRRDMVQNALDYLHDYDDNANYLFMGDFNVYDSDEPAYQLLTNNPDSDIIMKDPVNTPGDWHNNYTYRFFHTQSTHADQNGCASYGGMDDRFDFILMSDNIIDGYNHVKYVADSYITIGQDGMHFNKSINDEPLNQSAPGEVIDALYGNSDHLPIQVKISIDKSLGIESDETLLIDRISINSHVQQIFTVSIVSNKYSNLELQIMTPSGAIVFEKSRQLSPGNNEIEFDTNELPQGFYIAVFSEEQQGAIARKIVKSL